MITTQKGIPDLRQDSQSLARFDVLRYSGKNYEYNILTIVKLFAPFHKHFNKALTDKLRSSNERACYSPLEHLLLGKECPVAAAR